MRATTLRSRIGESTQRFPALLTDPWVARALRHGCVLETAQLLCHRQRRPTSYSLTQNPNPSAGGDAGVADAAGEAGGGEGGGGHSGRRAADHRPGALTEVDDRPAVLAGVTLERP